MGKVSPLGNQLPVTSTTYKHIQMLGISHRTKTKHFFLMFFLSSRPHYRGNLEVAVKVHWEDFYKMAVVVGNWVHLYVFE